MWKLMVRILSTYFVGQQTINVILLGNKASASLIKDKDEAAYFLLS